MRDKLDNFLLAILWLLASMLGVCFWFNIRFGFNIFSSAHWHHLAYMQAAQNPVSPLFYISMVISVIVVLSGLYLLVRPRLRKFRIPTRNVPTHIPTVAQKPVAQTQHTHTNNPPTPSVAPSATPDTTTMAPTLTRPPRLNIAITPQLFSAPPPQPTSATPAQNDWPEIREIFESAGYTVKGTPRIGATQTAILAIGTGEVLWLGAVGIPTTALQSAIDTINQIFSDTLDDIIINVNGFVISAPDATAPGAPNILTFDTPNALRQYMNEHRNPPLDEDDNGNFDAFSAYISTVIDYIGKI